MAVSDALLPSFSTFASGPAGREKTLRPAGAPNNVSVALGHGGKPRRGGGGDLLWVGWGRAEPWVTEDHLGVRGGGGHGTGSAAVPGRLPRPGLSSTCVWSGRGGAAGGARPVRTRPLGCRRQGGRAGHRAGGGCVHRHWLGLRAQRVGVPVARTHRESLAVPISGTAGASQGSGGGGTRAGEPRRWLTRNRADTT